MRLLNSIEMKKSVSRNMTIEAKSDATSAAVPATAGAAGAAAAAAAAI